ncbi:hypothetical protein [Labrenzia sp. OB1]|uniref:hypothetical protein n=1 Tax=Labrenzia sp. OB1 TaxID=1561204 RepID=UPI0007B29F51|nr:hypothetical protein [Labrenzia sp. OB1]KZM46164.1 hypothetical protein OA90_26790 [Labrenzia sp. OB1]
MNKKIIGGASETSLDFEMTDLEERLTGAYGVEVKNEVIEMLKGKITALSELISDGLGPDDLRSAKRVLDGLIAARDTLSQFPV